MKLALATLVLLAGTAAAEGQFQVEPTRVDLSTKAPAGAVIVTNHGHTPLRLEAKAFRWTDDVDGAAQLTPATEIVIRPSLVEVPPGASKTLRVGTTALSAATEGTFRVFIEELPDPKAQKRGQITVLTRIGVPIFLAPQRGASQLASTVALDGDHAVVSVKNSGTAHVKLMGVKVTAMHAGARRWQHQAAGWYVLAGAERRFAVGLDQDHCAAGDKLVGEVTDEDGHITTTPLGSCEP